MSLLQLSSRIHHRSEQLSRVVQACRQLLREAPEAADTRDYTASRCLPTIQEQFQLGFFPPDPQLGLLIDLVGEPLLKELGLIYSTYPYNLVTGLLNHHNLVIPYQDEYSNYVALIGRSLLSDEEIKTNNLGSKYKYTTQFSKSLYLFGLYQAQEAIRQTGQIIVVEGQIDCMSCVGHGWKNVVALGGSNLSRHQFYLANKNAERIALLLDNDAAGFKGEKKFKQMYSQYSQIKKIFLPEGYKDVDQYLSSQKPENS